jgi:hypothetical protein
VVFENKRVLEAYCKDDVNVLRKACCLPRREFIQIGYFVVFLESVTMASNKKMRKRFF